MFNRLLLALLFIPTIAFAQETRTQATANLMGLGMPGPLAEKVAGLSTGLGVLPNNTPIQWQQASGTPVAVLNVNASNQVTLSPGTTDGADNSFLALGGGGAAAPTNTCLERGGCIALYGNEDPGSNDGRVLIQGGNIGSTASVDIVLNGIGSAFKLLNSAGGELVRIDTSGNYISNATNGGDLTLARPGKTIALQESSPGAACMGSLTFNGTSTVVVNTTCAATGARIFLTPTSDPTGATAAYCWVASIVNGTSFSVDCDQANDGAANWIIFKESA